MHHISGDMIQVTFAERGWTRYFMERQLILKTWMLVVNFMVMVTIVHYWWTAVYWLRSQWSQLVYTKLSKLYNDTPRHMIRIKRFTSSQSNKESHGDFCCTFSLKKYLRAVPPTELHVDTSRRISIITFFKVTRNEANFVST